MADFIIDKKDIQSIFSQTFGYAAAGVLLDIPENNPNTQTRYGTDLYKKDKYGIDCFSPITLRYGSNELFLPYATVNITTSKNIVRTKLVNRKGSVKEHISLGDYMFTIRGILINREQDLPEDELAALKDIYDTRIPISIINPVTDFYLDADDKVIIKSLTLPPMTGVANAQAFVLDCETDSNLELILE